VVCSEKKYGLTAQVASDGRHPEAAIKNRYLWSRINIFLRT